jgi:hypothetical protein
MKTKTSKKTTARRSNANRAVKKGTTTRSKPVSEEKKIALGGKEHNRRECSRFYKQFELLRKLKGKTVAFYIEKGGDRDALNGAIKDGFVKVA